MLRAANDDAGLLHLRSLFGSIMQSYREEYHWWEVVAIGRRFLICACAALLSPRVEALTLSIFVILSVSLVVHVRASPFIFPLNNSLETANLTMVMFNYLAGILFSSDLLSNFDGMDVFVVTVNCAAILLMIHRSLLGLEARTRPVPQTGCQPAPAAAHRPVQAVTTLH